MIQNNPSNSQSNTDPLVSVIINCFNGEKYLEAAIESVLRQTYTNWEIVFWDNQSTDGSADIFQKYSDPRLKYYYAPKHTFLYEARNYAFEKVSGEFVAFLDSDDWWAPDKLERQIPLFMDLDVGMVCSNYWVISEIKNKKWKLYDNAMPEGWVLDILLKKYYVGLLSLVVRVSAVKSLTFFCDPRYHIIGDFDLVLRLATKWKLACIQDPLAFYRLHENNESSKHRSRHVNELEIWLGEAEQVSTFSSLRNFNYFKDQLLYLKGLNCVLCSKKKDAYFFFRDMHWSWLKIKLLAALFLPLRIVQKIKK